MKNSKYLKVLFCLIFLNQINYCRSNDLKSLESDSLKVLLNTQMKSLGVVYFIRDEEVLDTVSNLIIYNKDGSVYADLSTLYGGVFLINGDKYPVETIDDSLCSLLYKHGFKPKEFQPINTYIQFECKAIVDKYYEVFINKERNLTKFIKRSDTYFAFDPWNKHIFNCFIGFSSIRNPLRKRPDDNAPVYEYFTYEIRNYDFKVAEIKGDWMKIKSIYPSCDDRPVSKNKYNGWIRWRENNKVVIKTYYECRGEMPIPKY